MASIYDAAGQVFGRFGSGGDLAAGQTDSRPAESIYFPMSTGSTEFLTKPRKKSPKTTTSKGIKRLRKYLFASDLHLARGTWRLVRSTSARDVLMAWRATPKPTS